MGISGFAQITSRIGQTDEICRVAQFSLHARPAYPAFIFCVWYSFNVTTFRDSGQENSNIKVGWKALHIYILQLLWSQEEGYNLTDLSVFDGVSSIYTCLK